MAGTSTRQIVSGQVYNVSTSADGRYLSYTQDAGDVGTLYVVDLTDGFTRTIASGQAVSLGAQPIASHLSADGSFILFDNYAANPSALFVKDQRTGTTSQITLDSNKYDGVVALEISADGRFVIYNTHVVGTGGLNNPIPSQNVTVVRDLTTQTDVEVGPRGPSNFDTDLTPDGHYLSLIASNRVIVFDVRTGTTLLDKAFTSGPIPFDVRISDDGHYVAYDLGSTDRAVSQVYLHDMQNPGAPDRLVSTSADGTTANDSSNLVDFSGDGRHVLFHSTSSTNLGGTSGTTTYLKDLDTGVVQPLADGGLLSYDASTIITAGNLSGLYLTTVLPPSVTVGAIADDNIVNAFEEGFPVLVSGTSDTPGAHITVTSPSGATNSTTVRDDGTWSVYPVPASGVADGQHDFTVTATDAFGHTGTARQIVIFDSVAPFINYSLNDTSSINAAQLHASEITGQSDAVGQVVSFTIDGHPIGQATIQNPTPDSGDFGAYSVSFDASGFHDGVHILGVSISDQAGNVTSETLAFDVDTTPPAITISTVAGDDVVNSQEIDAAPVSGTSEAIGRTVTITAGGQIIGTAEVEQDGTWVADVTFEGSAGLTDVSASVADSAGNVGTAVHTAVVDANVIRVSTDSQGREATVAPGQVAAFNDPSISADGRFVLFFDYGDGTSFTSDAQLTHAYLKDLKTGALTVLSQYEDPNPDNYGGGPVELADDGRHLLYKVPSQGSVNVVDLSTGVVTQANTNAEGQPDNGGIQADNGYQTGLPHISADGRYVTFWSIGTNLVDGINDGNAHLYVKDLQVPPGQNSGNVSLVSFAEPEHDAQYTYTSASGIGAGRYVAFASNVALGSYDTNGVRDIFLRDLQTGDVTSITSTPSRGGADGESFDPVISRDGRFIAFDSLATNLTADPLVTPGFVQVYLFDTATGTTRLVSTVSAQQYYSSSLVSSISGDGRYVSFMTSAIGTPRDGSDYDVYVRDMQTDTLKLVSAGHASDSIDATQGILTPDGRYIVFDSNAPDNLPGDTNDFPDIFLRKLVSETLTLNPIAGDDRIEPSERSATESIGGTTTVTSGTVSVRLDGAEIATAPVQADGTWATTIDTGQVAAGRHHLVATIVDPLGFSTSDGSLLDVVQGTQNITVHLVHDTGGSAFDFVTSDPTLVYTTTEPGQTIDFSTDGVTYTPAQPILPNDGSYSISVRARDTTGAFTGQTTVFVVLDRHADTGASATLSVDDTADHVIDKSEAAHVAFSVAGLDVDARAVASFTDGVHAAVTANIAADGSFQVDLSGLSGTVTSSLAITDLAGNTASAAGNSVRLTAAPLAVSLALTTDSGTPGDGVTNVGTVNVTGLETGATYQYAVNGGVFVTGAGTSFTLTGDGPKAVLVRETDAAGNVSPNASLSFTLDTFTAAPAIALATDSGIAGDGITKVGTINVSGLETGATWQYAVNGGAFVTGSGTSVTLSGDGPKAVLVRQTDVAGNISGNASLNFTLDTTAATPSVVLATDSGIVGDGITKLGTVNVSGLETGATWQYAVNGGAFVIGSGTSVTLSGDGPKAVLVRQTDVAGNISGNASLNFTLDTAAAAPLLALAADSGIVGDGITKVGTINVSGLETGAAWQYAVNGGAFVTGSGTSITLTGDGPRAVLVHQTDAAGNISSNASLNFILDTTAPLNDTITTASASVTNPVQTIAGTGEAGSTIQLRDGAGNIGPAATVDGTGHWSQTVTLSAAGNHVITAIDTDIAGNSSTSNGITLTLNTGAIIGQPGQLVVNGTGGADHIVIGPTNLVTSAGNGDDIIKINATGGLSLHYIDGGSGTDTLDLSSLTGPLYINLDSGFGLLTPPGLQLFNSIENVIGGSGADHITASSAVNILTGGGGADTFIFSNLAAARNGTTFDAAKRDMITDFVHGTDRIDLSGIDANTGVGGTQHFSGISLWNGTGTEFTAPNQLKFHYETIGGQEHTIIDGNINGNLAVDFQIDLAKHIALTASDFILFA